MRGNFSYLHEHEPMTLRDLMSRPWVSLMLWFIVMGFPLRKA